MEYNYQLQKIGEDTFCISPSDDHEIRVYKLPYTDIQIFSVLYYDAYRDYKHSFMTAEEIKEKYNVNISIYY